MQKGFTLPEVLVAMLVAGVMMSIAVPNLRGFNPTAKNGASLVQSFFRQVRAKAVSQTSAYIVEPYGKDQLVTRFAASCNSASFTDDPRMVLDLPVGVEFLTVGWEVCYSARGLANQNMSFALKGDDGIVKTVEVLLGGATRVS